MTFSLDKAMRLLQSAEAIKVRGEVLTSYDIRNAAVFLTIVFEDDSNIYFCMQHNQTVEYEDGVMRLIMDDGRVESVALLRVVEPKFSREDFMTLFRSDELHEVLTVDDCLEVFRGILVGQSDLTRDLLQALCSDYDTSLDRVVGTHPGSAEGITTTVLATQLAEAYGLDEDPEVGGFDISAGMFGPNISEWVKSLAAHIEQMRLRVEEAEQIRKPAPQPSVSHQAIALALVTAIRVNFSFYRSAPDKLTALTDQQLDAFLRPYEQQLKTLPPLMMLDTNTGSVTTVSEQ